MRRQHTLKIKTASSRGRGETASQPHLGSSMFRVAVLALLGAAQGAVIGIDLGSRFLKVGIIQPGSGIELVLNEATKRKSSSTVCTCVRCAAAAVP